MWKLLTSTHQGTQSSHVKDFRCNHLDGHCASNLQKGTSMNTCPSNNTGDVEIQGGGVQAQVPHIDYSNLPTSSISCALRIALRIYEPRANKGVYFTGGFEFHYRQFHPRAKMDIGEILLLFENIVDFEVQNND
jgi:hypothetical protein